MQDTPRGLRLHIGIFGRRNVGKSSLLNALTRQPVSIVSGTPGTTTDPVEKTMELAPIGPVVFIDTAGVDDTGDLGLMRRERTLKMFDRTDLALIVSEGDSWGEYERELATAFTERKTPFIVVCSKSDIAPVAQDMRDALERGDMEWTTVSTASGEGLDALRALIARMAPEHAVSTPQLLADLVPPGGLAVLVTPIDLGAPKGRLILPQVQAIRDLLDGDAMCMVVKERELRPALARLSGAPDLVVCDSQVVLKAAADTPPQIPLTTFSILMARFKGDLEQLARGAAVIETLRPGDRVLIAEACSHHPLADDIGRVKIPRWLRQYAGGDLHIDVATGKDLPADISAYRLIIHCGGCVMTRGHMLGRIHAAAAAGVPITNYGLAISLTQGVLPRALACFPSALAAFEAVPRT